MKRCFKCGIEQPETEFYRHPVMGRLNKCKACTKRDVRENRARRRQQYIEYDRTRAQSDRRRSLMNEYDRRRRARDVAKVRARSKLRRAIRSGHLERQPCEVCKTTEGVQGHHEDYGRPLDVRWLCSKHHREEHAANTDAA